MVVELLVDGEEKLQQISFYVFLFKRGEREESVSENTCERVRGSYDEL